VFLFVPGVCACWNGSSCAAILLLVAQHSRVGKFCRLLKINKKMAGMLFAKRWQIISPSRWLFLTGGPQGKHHE